MATYTWNFSGTGLAFNVVYDAGTGTFTITCTEGALDVNALWFSDGDASVEGDTTLTKKDNSLNMNGTDVVWDDYAKLSSTGLGSAGTEKPTYLTAGESTSFTLEQLGLTAESFDWATTTLGVRATSTSSDGGSIKWVDALPDVGGVGDPWGDNPFTVLPSGATGTDGDPGLPGLPGDPGQSGLPGDPGTGGADGANADGVAPGLSPAGDGLPGVDGDPGTAGTDGGNGTDGGAGGDGAAALVVDQLAGHSAILIDAQTGDVEILGGDGGDGGAGGAGGAGGDGGVGGAGGDGGDGGDGEGTSSISRDGGDGGDGGAGGVGGAGAVGGDGGNGGDGGDGANAILNGVVTGVFIIGSYDVTILGGMGGAGGTGGAGGAGGAGGDGGDGGAGGDAGAKSTTSNVAVDGTVGDGGDVGDGGTTGSAGTAGTDGADGADAAAFSDAVNVDASAFTGHLTISGSDDADTFVFGTGGTTAFATRGSDVYTLNAAAAETIVYTGEAQSNGAPDTDTINGFVSGTDKIDLAAFGLTAFTDTTASVGGVWYQVSGSDVTVYADTDGLGGADMQITLAGIGSLAVGDFIL